ncbi:MAG: metallophosphoesterase [Fusobacteriaceae bacterium]
MEINVNDLEKYFGKIHRNNTGEMFIVTGIHSKDSRGNKRYNVKFLDDNSESIALGYNILDGKVGKKQSEEVELGKKVLVIGDVHAPFNKDGYREFCQKMYKKHKCNTVVFIGDIMDNHYSSFHDTDPDGMSANEELQKAVKEISLFYKAFPEAYVTVGNHDKLGDRVAFKAGLSNRWIKTLGEMLNTPNWKYVDSVTIGDFMFNHGTGRKASARCKEDFVSVVQGHYHSESYVEHYVGSNGERKMAVQVGCGIERDEFAFAYGKHFKTPHINVAIIDIENKIAFHEYMD